MAHSFYFFPNEIPRCFLGGMKSLKISPVEMCSFAHPDQIDAIEQTGRVCWNLKAVIEDSWQGNHFKFSFVTSSVLVNHIFQSSKKTMRE